MSPDPVSGSAYSIYGDTIYFAPDYGTGGKPFPKEIIYAGQHFYYDAESNSYKGIRGVLYIAITSSVFDPLRLTPLGMPTEIRGVPQRIWSQPQTSVGGWTLSMHVDQMRWAIAEIYVDSGNTQYEIPLLDANNKPWFSPEVPPMTTCRRATTSGDRVKEAYTTGTFWSDQFTQLRPNINLVATTSGVYWGLSRRDDPVPHWVIWLVNFYNAASVNYTVRFDLLGTGGHTHAASSRENLSAGTLGHWNVKLPWTQQAFNSAGSAAVLNERAYGLGAVDVVNDPGIVTAGGSLYLTTGVNQGTASGVALFTAELPMVLVLAHKLAGAANLVAAAAETSWIPESFGWGWRDDSYTNETNELHSFDSVVQYNTAPPAHIRAVVFNSSDSSGINVPDANLDRTYFVYSIGRRA